jgi:pSer/pThr/pTyr-binding forkhead associated (FHA) protein
MDPSEENPPDESAASETMPAHVRERPRPDREIGTEQFTAMNLEVVGGPMDGFTTHRVNNVLAIGRSPTNDLSLSLDPLVSANHARIVHEGSSFWLEDLDSRNGTYIGEQRIQGRTLIGPGTLFVLGNTCLEFMPS